MHYDVIIIGLGVIGAAVLERLARAARRVLGLDAHAPPHVHGGSHGETRLLRVAYFEGAGYVRLARRAIDGWRVIEARTGERLFEQAGVAYLGRPDAPVIRDTRAAAAAYDLRLDPWTEREALRRLPFIAWRDGWEACFEPEAGYVRVEPAVAALLRSARDAGASVRTDAPARVDRARDGFVVQTGEDRYDCARIVVAAGIDTPRIVGALAPEIADALRLERRYVHWATPGVDIRDTPPFVIAPDPEHMFYGFPPVSARGVKIAEHFTASPLEARRLASDAEKADAEGAFWRSVGECLRSGAFTPRETAGCVYDVTQTPGGPEHFIVDRARTTPGLYLACGFSGHGFKFAPAIGDMVRNLIEEREDADAALFSLDRHFGPAA